MSNIIKPTLPELNKCLNDLVKWQQFALYLPGIDHTDISIIEKDRRDDVAEQKRILYDKWLQVYPSASWDDVAKALQTAKENTIAKQLREKYNIAEKKTSSPYPVDPDAAMSPSGQLRPTEEVAVSEDIVTELDTLQRSFIGLTGTVKAEVERQLENGVENKIKSLTRDLQEEQAFPIPSLRSVTTSDELFDAIRPYYNFLNCYLIVSIALHLAGAIAEKATEYKEKVRKFMKTTKIQFLQNTLKRYSRMFCERSNSTTVVEIVVENGWGDQNVWLVKMLVKFLFPVKHPDELPWYDIVPGSIVMTFIAHEHMALSLIESSRKKIEFMRLVGVISLKIENGFVCWKKDEGDDNPFSFENCLIQATLGNNIEAVQFLLQYTQVNVNAKNTTITLINAVDIYYNEEMVKTYMEMYCTVFTALLENVENEFQYIQGQTTAVNNDDPNSTFLSAANGNSKLTHRPRDNFLNGRVLASLSNQLPEHLSTRVKQYQATINGIMKRKSLLIHLISSLEYFSTQFPDSIEVILTLHNAWRACSVWYVEQLGQLIFTPILFHKLQWFRVYTTEESLTVALLADKELKDSLTKECLGKDESLTSLLGVISVWVDDTVMINNDYINGYSFSEALKIAEAMGNDTISDLLLQIHQSPVDFIRLREPDSNNNHQFLPEFDSTSLMIACCNDNSQLVQLLLDHNANPNIQSRNSYTALMYSTGNSKIFQMLLDHRADIKSCSFLSETVLYYACRAGNMKVVKNILATNRDLVDVTTSNGQTPLQEASQYGYAKIVEMLLQAKADPNIQYFGCWNALQMASSYGHTEIVQILLQGKADPSVQVNKGWTALQSASRYGHTEIVEMLLQAKTNPNVQVTDGWTALQLASRYGYTEIVRMLLQAKADLNVQDNDGWTPLHHASRYGHTEIVRMLLQCRANPNLVSYEGLTALDLALQHDHTDISDKLYSVLFDHDK